MIYCHISNLLITKVIYSPLFFLGNARWCQLLMILNIKSEYEVKRNWQGYPWAPNDYSWDGLDFTTTIARL